MRGKFVVRELLFDPEIEKTAKANRKAARLAREAERVAKSSEPGGEQGVFSPHSSDDETVSMEEEEQ
ncbi:hypothetical protein A2U01_0009918 [Trifolium medium]|uniref:Uncharacterized protein n=1 Tax=Trifolium medium TaxID=97028 RepID=A0A392MPL2_9FABA|nr:hypothetical protein [Trifolium medium]